MRKDNFLSTSTHLILTRDRSGQHRPRDRTATDAIRGIRRSSEKRSRTQIEPNLPAATAKHARRKVSFRSRHFKECHDSQAACVVLRGLLSRSASAQLPKTILSGRVLISRHLVDVVKLRANHAPLVQRSVGKGALPRYGIRE